MNSAEKRLQRIAQLAEGMPMDSLRGFFAEQMVDKPEKIFRIISQNPNLVAGAFGEIWLRFQNYKKDGYFNE